MAGAASASTARAQIPAPFPSLLRVVAGRLIDEYGTDIGTLKGFNVIVGGGGDTFVWSQQNFTDMAAFGARIVRHAIFWDILEPSSGSIDQTYLATLDTSVNRAAAAGMYSILSLPHLLSGRVPTWAQTQSNNWLDLVSNGQNAVQTIAARYGKNPAVIGANANEPPAADLDTLMSGYQTIVPWYRELAPHWPIWLQGCRFGGSTPYPTGAGLTQLDPSVYAALDTYGRGCVIEYHDYLNADNGDTSTFPKGYLSDGTPAKAPGTSGGWQYHGTGGNWNYPNTSQSRTDTANHLADLVNFTSQRSSFVLAINEFGMDNTQSGEGAYGTDKANAYNTAGAQVQMWWDYDTATVVSNIFSARPGGGSNWRASVANWMAVTR